MKVIKTILNVIAQFKGVSVADYCHIETSSGKNKLTQEHYPSLLMTNGSLISGIELYGLNKIIGEDESREAHAVISDCIDLALSQGHSIDWGWTQNGLESERYLRHFFDKQKTVADAIGLNVSGQLEAGRKALGNRARPEHNVLYIITPQSTEMDKKSIEKLKTVQNDYMSAFDEHAPAQPFISALVVSEQTKIIHHAMVEMIVSRLSNAGYSLSRMGARRIPWCIKRDCSYREPDQWSPWLWGDKTTYKKTPEDQDGSNNLINWGGLSLGMQMHEDAIDPTGETGIAKVGQYYVAPLMLEMLPNDENWVTELINNIRPDIPFRYRISISRPKTMMQQFADVMARLTNFHKGVLAQNHEIANSFMYAEELIAEKVPVANAAISMCTWHTDLGTLKKNIESVKTAIASWGRAQVLVERGDLAEAVISTIPAYSTKMFTPSSLESVANIAKLTPHTRPASPFSDGTTLLVTNKNTFFPYSHHSQFFPAYIRIIIATTGGGKSVAQNAFNRDSNLKLGNKELARHVTIDIGPSGKGTVASMRGQLPLNRAHEVLYEKMSLGARHAFNPMDLQLGGFKPSPLDEAFIKDIVLMLCTPKGGEPRRLMAELIGEVVSAAYDYYFDPESAKEYSHSMCPEIDKVLAEYPEANDESTWNLKKTWIKVVDFLYERGRIREAIIAQRYAVPRIPELASVLAQSPSIRARYSQELTTEFSTMLSIAAKNYPLLTQPTVVEFDTARYIVLDLNDVTQEQGTLQTSIMYALCSQMATRDYWISENDVTCIREKYQPLFRAKVEGIRQSTLGVTFEEFRRTEGQKQIRNMINRWMAEGRKWGVFVDLVMQQPKHADSEMFGHATSLILMGTWNGEMFNQLKSVGVELSVAEKNALVREVRGVGPRGAPMLMMYNLKEVGWCSQILYLVKSPVELWATTTTKEDVLMREAVEELTGSQEKANAVLCEYFPKGSAVVDLKKTLEDAAILGKSVDEVYNQVADKAVRQYLLWHGKGKVK